MTFVVAVLSSLLRSADVYYKVNTLSSILDWKGRVMGQCKDEEKRKGRVARWWNERGVKGTKIRKGVELCQHM